MRVTIVSGLSGSGKSVALNVLEDLGFYCIDNIPARLLSSFLEDVISNEELAYDEVGLGLDARNRPDDLTKIPELVADLRTVNATRIRPTNAAISVSYRGYWFSILDNDPKSKNTFTLMLAMTSLSKVSVDTVKPVLTLPVGG